MHAKKYYGQNFINNPRLINQIVNLLEPERNAENLVIEIGPGRGALTKQLTERFKQVIAIEVDADLVQFLKINNHAKNLEVIEADVLKIDWQKLIEKYKKPHQKVSIISNLPYYITSPILFTIYQHSALFDQAVFMMQKEVAQRVTASKSTKNYNNLSVISQFFGDINYAFDVPKTFFVPQPKVDSAVIKIAFSTNHHMTKLETEAFVSFVRGLFNNRRKTILNNLSRIIKNRTVALGLLDKVKIDSNLRPEDLNLSDFINLFTTLKQNN